LFGFGEVMNYFGWFGLFYEIVTTDGCVFTLIPNQKSKFICVNLWFQSLMYLRITEIFLSIQGESSHAGRTCSFVRLTGCPMRCVWCDSEYTFYGGEKIQFADIFA